MAPPFRSPSSPTRSRSRCTRNWPASTATPRWPKCRIPARTFAVRRDLTIALDAQCRQCHFANYTKTLDSVHQQAVARGDRTAPVCVDCHGSHDVKKPSARRGAVSQTCAKCHEGVAAAYARQRARPRRDAGQRRRPGLHRLPSRARRRRAAQDASGSCARPRCAARCHANAAMMDEVRAVDERPQHLPVGLPRQDRVAAQPPGHAGHRRRSWRAAPTATACTTSRSHARSAVAGDQGQPAEDLPAVPRGRDRQLPRRVALALRARACTRRRWSTRVKLGYAVIIPFMIGGLGLQILLHLWRLMANR